MVGCRKRPTGRTPTRATLADPAQRKPLRYTAQIIDDLAIVDVLDPTCVIVRFVFSLFCFFRSVVDKFGVGRGPDWRFANETADTLARKNNTHWLLLFFPLKTTQMFLEWNSRLRLPSCLIVLRIDRLLGGLINVRNGPLFVSERPNLTFRSKSNQGRFRIFFFWLEPVFWKRGS